MALGGVDEFGEGSGILRVGERANGSEELERRLFHLLGEPAPARALGRFDRHQFVEGGERPGGLGVQATVGIA